ncbi:MAG: TonB-dependent receptor [Bacteroides sp.]|nr:TonB-dependent receptor [Bacteroides sp.]
MKDNNIFDLLKFRAGYGLTGNQNIPNYIYTEILDAKGQYNFGSHEGGESSTAGTIYPYRLSNPDIKWESVEQYNAGFDMGFLNNRISLTVDLYLKNTKDMLTRVPVPQTTGVSLIETDNPYINVGKVRNQGIEISLNTINVQTKDFHWNTGFNIAFNKNKMVKIGDWGDIYEYLWLIREGQPINVFYGYKVDHIYQNLDDVFTEPAMAARAPDRASHDPYLNTSPGDIAFKKFTDGDVVGEEDRVIMGNPNPKSTAGLTSNFSYKSLDISFTLQGVYGNKIFNEIRREHENMSTTVNQLASTLNRWTGEGTSYDMPRAIYADPNDNNRVSDRYVEDGSFIKLRNLNIGYRLPQKWTSAMRLGGVRLYSNIDNLFTITNYSGLDPEVGVNGRDYVIYPPARTFMFGINVNF